MTKRLAAASARHPWRTVGGWIAAVVVSIGLGLLWALWAMFLQALTYTQTPAG